MIIVGWLGLSPPAWSKTDDLRPATEYGVNRAILLSADLFAASYHAPELIQAITQAGADVVIATNADQSRRQLAGALLAQGVERNAVKRTFGTYLPHGNIWLRDYGPLEVRTRSGLESGSLLASFRYEDPAARVNNHFPASLAQALHLRLLSLPLALDGGNLLVAGDLCMTSTQEASFTNEGELHSQLSKLGCRKVHLITDAPHAHLDMWVKAVSDRKVLVNEIDAAALRAAVKYYGRIPPELISLRDNLDLRAAELAKVIEVQRIPMPLPYRGSFRTYLNSILVNGHAIVPSYTRFGWNYDSYPDASLHQAYEARVRKIYGSLGFKVSMINADGLIFNGGAFHCVTLPLPFSGADITLKQANQKGS